MPECQPFGRTRIFLFTNNLRVSTKIKFWNGSRPSCDLPRPWFITQFSSLHHDRALRWQERACHSWEVVVVTMYGGSSLINRPETIGPVLSQQNVNTGPWVQWVTYGYSHYHQRCWNACSSWNSRKKQRCPLTFDKREALTNEGVDGLNCSSCFSSYD